MKTSTRAMASLEARQTWSSFVVTGTSLSYRANYELLPKPMRAVALKLLLRAAAESQ